MKPIQVAMTCVAVFTLMSGSACGPTESLPPGNDAGVKPDAGETCLGVCAPLPEANWGPPAIVWVGAEADAPHCSALSYPLGDFYAGYGDPEGSVCGACTCKAPSGSCKPPATLTAAAASCAGDGPGVAHTPFDPPASWDGSCTASNAIPAGTLCGGVPCVQSVTSAPLTLKPGGCLPVEPVNHPPPIWKTVARACAGGGPSVGCGTQGAICTPKPPSAGFRVCTLRPGDPTKLDCPYGYPVKTVFYDDPVANCSPCACGVPTDGICTGFISLFQNGTCAVDPVQTVSVNAKGPTCTDVPPGSALGSKAATELSYSGGYCTPIGGAPQAEVICCIP